MHLRQLEYFVAVCECSSFTKAAERLFVAQPSLSQQIKRLEADLKVTLLDRASNGVRPTPAGRVLLPAARDILAAVARAEQGVRDVRTGQRGDLQVLAVRSVATGILPPAVAQWHETFPNVVLKINDYPHREAMEVAFGDGQGDVAIGPKMDHLGTEAATLGFEELVLVAGATSGLLEAKQLGLGDLKTQQWVLFDVENGLTRVIRGLCSAAGFEPIAAVWTGQVETALEIASGGVAVTLIPNNAVRGEAGRFTRSLTPPIFREICAYSRPGRNHLSSAYIDMLSTARLPLIDRGELPRRHILA